MSFGPEQYIPAKNYGTAEWLKDKLATGAYHELFEAADYAQFRKQLAAVTPGRVAVQCLFAETQEELEDHHLYNWITHVYDCSLHGADIDLRAVDVLATKDSLQQPYELTALENVPIITLSWSDINWQAFNPLIVNALNN